MTRFFVASLLALLFCLPAAAQTSGPAAADVPESPSYAILKSGERREGRFELKTSHIWKPYLLFEDSTKLKLGDVSAYHLDGEHFARVDDKMGFFVKRIEEGRIDLYRYARPRTDAAGLPSTDVSAPPREFLYFSKDQGAVLPASARNLKVAMSDDPQALDILQQRQLLAFSQVGFAAAGLAVAGVSLARAEEGEGLPTGVYVGAAIAAVSWIPHFARRSMLDQAIRVYNR